MAAACGISYDVLAWTAEWYVREETLRAANLAIIELPPTAAADRGFRRRHPVVLGRAAVPDPGQVDHRPALNKYFADGGPLAPTPT